MAKEPQSEMDGKNFLIVINDETKIYEATTLQKFVYFRTYFSKRWRSHQKDENGSKSTMKCMNVGKHIFGWKHFDQLVNICKTSSIDPNLTFEDFSKLIECDLYFGCDCLTTDVIINFLELRYALIQ